MKERQVRFSIVTDDINRSISLYKDAIGLAMRPICNPIAMFSFGVCEFEVCQRGASQSLLQFDFEAAQTSGLLVSLALDSEAELERAEKAALKSGAIPFPEECSSNTRCFRDFNGVNWHLSYTPRKD